MIDLYTWSTPNGRKVSIMLEECGLDIRRSSHRHLQGRAVQADFLKISPNNRIPAIIDRDNGRSLFESGAILMYLAEKTGKFWPKDADGALAHDGMADVADGRRRPDDRPGASFREATPRARRPYAEERYLKEAHRLYGVLDRRLARGGVRGRRPTRSPTWRPGPGSRASSGTPSTSNKYPERAALVQGDRGAPGGGEGLSRAGQAARHPHAGLRHRSATDLREGTTHAEESAISRASSPRCSPPSARTAGPDAERFVEHCQWLMAEGCTGLAPFGTTSEGNSLGLDERMELLEELVDDGDRTRPSSMPGTGTCSLADAIVLTQARRRTRLRRRADAAALLLQGAERGRALPLLRRGDRGGRRRPAQGLSLSHPAGGAGRLLAPAHRPPDQGVPRHRRRPQGLLGRLEQHGGDPRQPIRASRCSRAPRSSCSMVCRKGAAGCISATCNVSAAAIRNVYDNWQGADADKLQAGITALRKAIQAFPMIPALKALIAHYRQDPGWAKLRPPFTALPAAEADTAVIRTLADAHGFKLEFDKAAVSGVRHLASGLPVIHRRLGEGSDPGTCEARNPSPWAAEGGLGSASSVNPGLDAISGPARPSRWSSGHRSQPRPAAASAARRQESAATGQSTAARQAWPLFHRSPVELLGLRAGP